MSENILLLLVGLPLIGAFLCSVSPAKACRQIALLFSLIGVALAYQLYANFESLAVGEFQFALRFPWIEKYRVFFALGVDGLSLPMLMLAKFIMPLAILASWNTTKHMRAFMACYLILDSAMAGTFLATDVFLFYVFWEMVLIPMILIIGVWGSQQRIYAALKFFLVTFAGSLLMLVAIFWLYVLYQQQFGDYSANIASFYRLSFSKAPVLWGLSAETLVFLAFAIAFCIKVPLFPLHTWLPDAHVQAPTGGSIILAAVLLKMGTYGLLRFCIPITPNAFETFTPLLVWLGLIGIVYGAWVAFQQADMKKLVAYSSVSHLGFIVIGICAANTEALTGAVLQMINHGVSTGALFFLVGILYERRHTRLLSDYGGLAKQVPKYSIFLVLVACSSIAVPGLNGFVGEFLILLGTFKTQPIWALVAVTGVVFAAIYMLWMVRGVLWGPLDEENQKVSDLNLRESLVLGVFAIFIVWMGVYPKPFVEKIKPTLEAFWEKPTTLITQKAPEEPKS